VGAIGPRIPGVSLEAGRERVKIMTGLTAGAAALAVGVLALAGCSSGSGTKESALEGTLTGMVRFGGEGNHDGLVNAKACNEDEDVDDYYKVTTYTSLEGEAGDLGAVQVQTAHCNSPKGPQDGQIAILTEDGDQLFGEYSTEADGQPIAITFMSRTTQDECYLLGADEGEVECRGTGRFAAAQGSAAMSVSVTQTDADPFVPWDASARWVDGTVTYAAE
jgi:hypothetical protein